MAMLSSARPTIRSCLPPRARSAARRARRARGRTRRTQPTSTGPSRTANPRRSGFRPHRRTLRRPNSCPRPCLRTILREGCAAFRLPSKRSTESDPHTCRRSCPRCMRSRSGRQRRSGQGRRREEARGRRSDSCACAATSRRARHSGFPVRAQGKIGRAPARAATHHPRRKRLFSGCKLGHDTCVRAPIVTRRLAFHIPPRQDPRGPRRTSASSHRQYVVVNESILELDGQENVRT